MGLLRERMGPFQEQRPLERSGPNPAMLQNFDSAYFLDRPFPKSQYQMKNDLDFLVSNQDQYKDCFKEAKRRLQMCSQYFNILFI